MKILAVIPARYASSRMPGKPLMDISGKPMVWWVYKACSEYLGFSDAVIATDSNEIYEECRRLDMRVIMTSGNHDTPTSRLCEVASRMEADYYLMVMGDEPLIDQRCFDLIIPDEAADECYVAALSNLICNPAEVVDYTNQKVVTNSERNVLMISRNPIPYPKGCLDIQYEKVTGVQIFSRNSLLFYEATPKSRLERAEENDLMRFVEHGIPVKIIQSPYRTISVDTHKDLEEVRKLKEGTLHGKK